MPPTNDNRVPAESSLTAYENLVAVIRRLRKECPWDWEQTHESMRHLLVEEAYEVVEAIEQGDYEELKKELGDVALQVIFHSVIAEERDYFSLEAVLEAITEKLVQRHPHVFGDTAVAGVQEVRSNWEEIKRAERRGKSVLESIPAHLPALLSAYRMQEKAANVGFDFATAEDAWAKVEEELQEYREAVGTPQAEAELGDVLFALVNYARRVDINAENALRAANRRFKYRFSYMESQLTSEEMRNTSIEELEQYWRQAKRREAAMQS